MTDSMVSEDSPDFFRVPGVQVRDPSNNHHDQNSSVPADIRNDPRFSNAPAKECKVEFEKNKGRFLSSTMTALVQQRPLPAGEERIHGVLFPNKMTHEQALTIDKFGDGLKTIEVADRTGTALDGNIHSLQDMTGGRKQKKYDGASTMGSSSGGGSSSLSGH